MVGPLETWKVVAACYDEAVVLLGESRNNMPAIDSFGPAKRVTGNGTKEELQAGSTEIVQK